MVKIQTFAPPQELDDVANKTIQQRDRYILGVAQSQRSILSRKKSKELSRIASINSPQKGRGSMFKYLSPFGRSLSTADKNVWKSAAVVSGLNGWQLFISDSAMRLKNYLSLGALPDLLWQVRTGIIKLESGASQILLRQDHPLNYWITRSIKGRSWKKELYYMTEFFSLPLTLKIRYKSDLTAVGATQRFRYFANVITSYQGVDRDNIIQLDLTASTDWVEATGTLSQKLGYIVSYTLYIEVYGYSGSVLIDNLVCEHNSQNWARDPRCDDVDRIFVKQFAIVKPFGDQVVLPAGASFETTFPPIL